MKKTNFTRPRYVLKNSQGDVLRSYQKPKDGHYWSRVAFEMMRVYQDRINSYFTESVIYGNARSINVNITSDSST